jgi:splicing factor 1
MLNVSARVSRWEDDTQSNNIEVKLKGARRSGWTHEHDKAFTPQTFSFMPRNQTIEEFEIWISKIYSFLSYSGRHRLDDLQRRITMSDYEQNDPDIRSPSPEPIYDPKTGLRMNTRD